MIRTIRLAVEYDGTAYAGWQRQGDLPTVQAELERGLEVLCQHPVRVRAASRTDAGVHARGQVVAFETDSSVPLRGFERGVNPQLPGDIRVQAASEGSPGWDPRRESRGKSYRYVFWTGPTPSALDRHRAWHVRGELDLDAMGRAAESLLGAHDFEAFRASGCVARHAVRTMHRFSVERGLYRQVHLVVVGNAFVKNMVRIFAGTLAEVGLGRRSVDSVADVLASKDRTRAGVTAPAQGLTLEEVIFDDRLPPRPQDDGDLDAAGR
ncbi:MAG TPA: tRNA pseudouridine(38-40) synthase TruA [Myxococcales bacterium LLY-WYZ-16_1]|nr:tRNA pseudouridine(38-40) synthase TruA [Myxococcales bacterium LLY-WYZ-16_1]